MKTQTKESQAALTPEGAIVLLKEGNKRFIQNSSKNRDLSQLVQDTSSGQFPFAVVLSCIDSRVPVELVFDQAIGDVFSVRVAGNIVNEDVLGSIEYGCKVVGSKVLVVMGHTKCGAVTAACNGVELGNITALLNKIKPAVESIKSKGTEMDEKTIEEVSIKNVALSIDRIRKESPILSDLEKEGKIKIVGASYDVETGLVAFF